MNDDDLKKLMPPMPEIYRGKQAEIDVANWGIATARAVWAAAIERDELRKALEHIINRAGGKTVRVSNYERDVREIARAALEKCPAIRSIGSGEQK